MKRKQFHFLIAISTLMMISCSDRKESARDEAPIVIEFTASTFSEADFITQLTDDPSGKTFRFGAGTYNFTNTIPLAELENFTIQGAGLEETIFDFSNSTSSSGEGIAAIDCLNLVFCGFTVQNTNGGNGITARNIKGIRFNEVGTVWPTRDSRNGVYGIYPVESDDVIIENCYAQAAIDAGIYSGQNKRVIIRNNKMTGNVFGMEVENNINAEVYGNEFVKNTAGLLVYDLAGVERIKNGYNTKVYDNTFIDNNETNFAEVGSTFAADVPPGVGLLYASTSELEVTSNTFTDNETASILGIAYFIVDPNFNPLGNLTFTFFNKKIFIHDNSYSSGGGVYNEEGVMDRQFGPLYQLLVEKNGGERPQILVDDQDYTDEGLPVTGNRAVILESSSPSIVEASFVKAVKGEINITSKSLDGFSGTGNTFEKFSLKNEPSPCK